MVCICPAVRIKDKAIRPGLQVRNHRSQSKHSPAAGSERDEWIPYPVQAKQERKTSPGVERKQADSFAYQPHRKPI